jgi:hypothetical protein
MGEDIWVPTIFSIVLALVVENRFYAFDRGEITLGRPTAWDFVRQ